MIFAAILVYAGLLATLVLWHLRSRTLRKDGTATDTASTLSAANDNAPAGWTMMGWPHSRHGLQGRLRSPDQPDPAA